MTPLKYDSILGSAQPKSAIAKRPRRRNQSSFAVVANEAKLFAGRRRPSHAES
jgi:hypothetical protein